jgi:hypothetical protein
MAGSDKVDDLIAHYAKNYSTRNVPSQFELACIHVFAQDASVEPYILDGAPSDTVNLREYNPGGRDDKTIDGVLWSEDSSDVIILQAKYGYNDKPAELRDLARTFFMGLEMWQGDRVSRANQSVRNLLDRADFDPHAQNIRLIFCVSANINGEKYDELRECAEDAQQSYSQRSLRVRCEVFGGNDLVKQDASLRSERLGNLPDEPWTADLGRNRNFLFDENGNRVLVAALKANAINAIYQKYQSALFSSNIRLGLGTGRINGAIERTIKESPNDFFIFNNGLTITCSSMDTSQLAKGKVVLQKPQVVNGAQTVMALARALKKRNNPSDAWVMTRFIETNEQYRSDRTIQITKYQNTQNAVKDWDFRANDKIQFWLFEQGIREVNSLPVLKKMGLEFFYEYKRGIALEKSRARDQILLRLDKLRHLRYCVMYGPVEVYTKPKAFWVLDADNKDDARLYWKAFGRDGEEVDYYNGEEIAQIGWALATNQKLVIEAAEYRKKSDTEQNETLKATYESLGANLKALSRWVMALAASGVNLEVKKGKHSYVDIMTDIGRFNSIYKEFVGRAMKVMNSSLEKRKLNNESRPSVNLSKSSSDWTSAQQSLLTELTIDKVI